MGAFVNGTIPSAHDPARKLFEYVELERFKLANMTKDRDSLRHELRNVYLSVRQHGYITLHDEQSGEKITLIEKPKEPVDGETTD